eukprot:tig00000692_g3208.t1
MRVLSRSLTGIRGLASTASVQAGVQQTSVFGSGPKEPVLDALVKSGLVWDRPELRGNKKPLKVKTAAEAAEIVKSGDRIFVHGSAATPNDLIWGVYAHKERLRDVEFTHIHVNGEVPYGDPDFRKSFDVANLFCGHNIRGIIDYDNIDYLPCFMSDAPRMVRDVRPVSVALLHICPPDADGWSSLGTSTFVARTAAERADRIIAIVNPTVPRIGGAARIHMSMIDRYIESDKPIYEVKAPEIGDAEMRIGQHVAGLIEDGSCLQVGIGAVPEAVLVALRSHRRLGVHTEMFSDGVMELMKSGAVDNSEKVVRPGKAVVGFLQGSRSFYNFLDNNPLVESHEADFTNNPAVISRNPKAVSINSATQVDLTGQVCADSIGHRIISGVGGQMDFMLGASQSKGGKAIIALTARTAHGQSHIVPAISLGGGVVTSRPNVGYVVTEFGVAQMVGKTLHERARALIDIAHPDDREALEREWVNNHKKQKAAAHAH